MTGFFAWLFGSKGADTTEAAPQREAFRVETRSGRVFRLPDEVAEQVASEDELNRLEWIESSWLRWNGRYFIYSLASLPLTDTAAEPEHGLWVEVNQQDFDEYQHALTDRLIYARYTAHGVLANHWPGFENTRGDDVRIQVLGDDGKPEILEIFTDHPELAELARKPEFTEADFARVRARLQGAA